MPPLGMGMKDCCLDTLFSLGEACEATQKHECFTFVYLFSIAEGAGSVNPPKMSIYAHLSCLT